MLKKFGCRQLTQEQMEFLIQTFTGMVHLSLYMYFPLEVYECKFNLFSSLKHLRSLCINVFDISGPYLDIILDALGSEVTHLEVPDVDLFKLAEKCNSVECLHLTSEVYNTVKSVDVLKKLPGLKSVKCLCVRGRYPEVIACFVSLCQKVEVLDVYFYEPDCVGIIVNAFINEPLTAL